MRVPEKDTLCVYCGTDLEKRDAMNDVVVAAKKLCDGTDLGYHAYRGLSDSLRAALKKLEEG